MIDITDKIRQLFQEELEQLAEIKSICENPQYQHNELINRYEKMAAAFERNLQAMMKMTKISDSQQVYLQDIQRELEREIEERIKAEEKLADSYKRYRRNHFLLELAEGNRTFDAASQSMARQLMLYLPSLFHAYYVQLISWRNAPFSRTVENAAEIQAGIDTILDKLNGSAVIVAWEWGDGIGVLQPALAGMSKEQQIAAGLSLKNQLIASFPHMDIRIGVAGKTGSPDNFSRYCSQARSAVNLGCRLWPGQTVYHYEDGEVDQLLYQLANSHDAEDFIERAIGKLLEHDRKNHSELVATLKTILRSANLKVAAETMFLHHKTMVSRKQRIETILGISLDSFDTRFNISIALRLLRLRGGD